MNEHNITIGMLADTEGYYAMWCNDGTVYEGKTADEAVLKLFSERYPDIWAINDQKDEEKPRQDAGQCNTHFVKRD